MDRQPQSAGFWARTIAQLIDTFMILTPITLLLALIFGYTTLKEENPLPAGILQIGLFALVVIAFWVRRGYTPGKKVMRLIVLDTRTMRTLRTPQAIWRFVCYFLSMISLIGFVLPLLRKDKKALHDLLSHSAVFRL